MVRAIIFEVAQRQIPSAERRFYQVNYEIVA